MSVLSTVPQTIRAGDTVQLLMEFSDYSASIWTGTLYFENNSAKFNATSVASGSAHSFTIIAATTATKKPGSYRWFIRMAAAGVVDTVDDGWIEIEPDPAASTNADRRTWAMRTLDAIEATLEGRATSDQLAMAINGRSISRIPLIELTDWRAKLRQEVRAESGVAGAGRDIKVRIGNA